MSNVEYIVRKHTIETYGDLIIPDTPVFDEITQKWKVQLSSTYPRIIDDEQSKETIVRFLDLKDLGTIELNKDLNITKSTSAEFCEHQVISRLELWKKISEKIIITTSSDVFAKIAEGRHVLYPLWQVLGRISKLQISGNDNILRSSVIDQQKRSLKMKQYLELLEELDIVKKINDGYTYGNIYVGLVSSIKTTDTRTLQSLMLSHVIKRKYSTLRQVFGITQLEPYVHLANAYYWPSLDAEKLVYTTRSRLYQRFQDFYSRISSLDFESKLDDLIHNGALYQENGYLIGNKDYFDDMLRLKQKVVLNP